MSNCNCQCEEKNAGCCHSECGSEDSCSDKSCCPIEAKIEMWEGSFCKAMRMAQVEILKEKIRKAWGSMLEKEAEAVLDAMEVSWEAKLKEGKARADLREAIQKSCDAKAK